MIQPVLSLLHWSEIMPIFLNETKHKGKDRDTHTMFQIHYPCICRTVSDAWVEFERISTSQKITVLLWWNNPQSSLLCYCIWCWMTVASVLQSYPLTLEGLTQKTNADSYRLTPNTQELPSDCLVHNSAIVYSLSGVSPRKSTVLIPIKHNFKLH